MAEEAAVLAEAAKLPIDERVAHSNWKVRSAAYEFIKSKCGSVFDPSDPCLAEFGECVVRCLRVLCCSGTLLLHPLCLAVFVHMQLQSARMLLLTSISVTCSFRVPEGIS
jgi:hypothetical protein